MIKKYTRGKNPNSRKGSFKKGTKIRNTGRTRIKKGQKLSEETKRKIGVAQIGNKHRLGKKHTEEWKINASERMKGNKNRLGHYFSHSRETKDKMSIKKLGNKNPAWLGGKSFKVYSSNWTRTLRRSIRERDKYICRICNEQQGDAAFSVHHIDYDKDNCNPDNLITLCKSCHQKTNFNRDYWVEKLQNFIWEYAK